MARKPILSAGVAMVSAAAIVAAGPSLFAPGSGQVEAAAGSKPLDSVHVGYRMTALSDITLGGFLDALANGYSGGRDALDASDNPYEYWTGDPNGYGVDAQGVSFEDSETGSVYTAAYYLLDNILPSDVLVDDYFFRWGPAAATEAGVGALTGGPDTLPVAVTYYLWHPMEAVYVTAELVGQQFGYTGLGKFAVDPLMIPVALADQLAGDDVGDIVYALVTANVFSASGLTAKLLLQKVGDAVGVDILGAGAGTLLDALSKFGTADNVVPSPAQLLAGLTGNSTATDSGSSALTEDASSNTDGEKLAGSNVAAAFDAKIATIESSVASAIKKAVVPTTGQSVTIDSTTATDGSASGLGDTTTDPSSAAELATPAVGTLPKLDASLLNGSVVKTAAEKAAPVGADSEAAGSTQNAVADDAGAVAKTPGSKLGQRLQDSTSRITGGLQKAGKQLSSALGGSKKNTTKTDTTKTDTAKTDTAAGDSDNKGTAKQDSGAAEKSAGKAKKSDSSDNGSKKQHAKKHESAN